jgi:hypothetical protein
MKVPYIPIAEARGFTALSGKTSRKGKVAFGFSEPDWFLPVAFFSDLDLKRSREMEMKG